MAVPEGPIKEACVCDTETGTEADVENEDVDVFRSVDETGVPGYESKGFTLSQILRRKRTVKKSVSKVVVDTAHRPQCEFSNLQALPVPFLIEIFCWPVLDFY